MWPSLQPPVQRRPMFRVSLGPNRGGACEDLPERSQPSRQAEGGGLVFTSTGIVSPQRGSKRTALWPALQQRRLTLGSGLSTNRGGVHGAGGTFCCQACRQQEPPAPEGVLHYNNNDRNMGPHNKGGLHRN